MARHSLKISISGARGIIGESFTPQVACAFAKAFGAYVGRGPVVVGRDTRPSGMMVQQAVRAGLMSVGCTVLDVGIVPTPTVLINVKKLRAVGGICVTASHNPNEWNALKFVNSNGVFLNKIQATELLDIYHQGDVIDVANADIGLPEQVEGAFDVHRELVLRHLDVACIRAAKLRVAVDCCNGAAAPYTRGFLEELGCECLVINDTPDGLFPHPPEPTPEHLTQLCDHVRATRADVGFAQDPDADRLAIIDETGRPIGEDYTLVLATQHALRTAPEPRVVVANVAITKAFDDVAAAMGATVVHTPVGEINVTEEIIRRHAVIGGESNGGVILPAVHPCRDSFAGMGLILEAMARAKKSMSGLMADVPRYVTVKTKHELSGNAALRVVQALRKRQWGADTQVTTVDGVRIDWPDRWALVRASNTEPVVRIIAEARTATDAASLVADIWSIAQAALA